MSEFLENLLNIAKLATLNKDITTTGRPEGQKRNYDSDVYTPAGQLGFEMIGRDELQNVSAPDLNAFEGSAKRHLRDKIVAQVGTQAENVVEQVLVRNAQPYPLDHTLGHIRHPDLFLTVGPPFYDTALLGHIAHTASLANASGADMSLETNRARRAQDERWRRRFATSGEDWYGKLMTATEIARKLVTEGGSFSTEFPIDAQQPIDLRYAYGDKSNELVAHNLALLRDSHPELLSELLPDDEAVRKRLANGLVLTRDVFIKPGYLPAESFILDGMDLYLAYLDKMRSLVGKTGDVEQLDRQQAIFDKEYNQYTRIAP